MPRNDSTPPNPTQINLIAVGTSLEGTLLAEADIRVNGTLKGILKVKGKAIIAPEGRLEGEVHAVDADVAGTIKGDLVVSGRLVLKGSARIEGTIKTARLIVEEGAVIDGTCRMGQLDPKRAAALQSGEGAQSAPSKAGAKPARPSSFSLLADE